MDESIRVSEAARELGVPVPTLRSWERRYGWPTPDRTTGGHRRYTENELDRLRVLVEMTRWTPVSRAVAVLKALDDEGIVGLERAAEARRSIAI